MAMRSWSAEEIVLLSVFALAFAAGAAYLIIQSLEIPEHPKEIPEEAPTEISEVTPVKMAVFTFENDAGTLEVLKKHYREGDYTINNANLFREIPDSEKVQTGRSLQEINRTVRSGGAYDMVMYDPEHWRFTPAPERNNIPASVSSAAKMVRDANYKFGLTPDRSFTLEHYQNIDWSEVDHFNMQFQVLAKPNDYSEFTQSVKTVSNFVRDANPDIEIFVQMSFRYSDADTMIAAIDSVEGYVDGYTIAYLDNAACEYCSLSGLERVLSHIRPS